MAGNARHATPPAPERRAVLALPQAPARARGLPPDTPLEQRERGHLSDAYGAWLEAQAKIPLDSARREETRRALLKDARRAQARIQAGVDLLSREPDALEAFRLMNRA